MIAVDTSALMAILLREAQAQACRAAFVDADGLVISAATVVEAAIVSSRRKVGEEMAELISDLGIEVVSVSPAFAARAVQAHRRWARAFIQPL